MLIAHEGDFVHWRVVDSMFLDAGVSLMGLVVDSKANECGFWFAKAGLFICKSGV